MHRLQQYPAEEATCRASSDDAFLQALPTQLDRNLGLIRERLRLSIRAASLPGLALGQHQVAGALGVKRQGRTARDLQHHHVLSRYGAHADFSAAATLGSDPDGLLHLALRQRARRGCRARAASASGGRRLLFAGYDERDGTRHLHPPR